jgi:hypothetical protein
MTKNEMIEKYGVEWYERLKERNRLRAKAVYDANPEAERERRRQRYAKNPEQHKDYYHRHREVYRINMRDRNRLTLLMKIPLEGKEVHHLKYHADNNDKSWIDDIVILTPEEHEKWHREHPDFVAKENIV